MKKEAIILFTALAGFGLLLPLSGKASPALDQMNPARFYEALLHTGAMIIPDKGSFTGIVLLLLVLFILLLAWTSYQLLSPARPAKKEVLHPVLYRTPKTTL